MNRENTEVERTEATKGNEANRLTRIRFWVHKNPQTPISTRIRRSSRGSCPWNHRGWPRMSSYDLECPWSHRGSRTSRCGHAAGGRAAAPAVCSRRRCSRDRPWSDCVRYTTTPSINRRHLKWQTCVTDVHVCVNILMPCSAPASCTMTPRTDWTAAAPCWVSHHRQLASQPQTTTAKSVADRINIIRHRSSVQTTARTTDTRYPRVLLTGGLRRRIK